MYNLIRHAYLRHPLRYSRVGPILEGGVGGWSGGIVYMCSFLLPPMGIYRIIINCIDILSYIYKNIPMLETKVCTKCGIENPWTKEFFYAHTKTRLKSMCKACCNKRTTEWIKRNPKKASEYKKKCPSYGVSKGRVYDPEYYKKNKARMTKSTREWMSRNPEKIKASQRLYYENNKEKIAKYNKDNRHKWKSGVDYYAENREEILRKHSERYASDEEFKLKSILRRRIWKAMKAQSHKKTSKTAELVGCPISDLKKHLESKFTDGMSWSNYGKDGWHIDHIRPCASFDLTDPEQQLECFNYKNLQPLWARDNLSKGDRWG